MIGRIKMYNEDRNFGYILGENEENYFFHISEFRETIVPDREQVVSFNEGVNNKGKIATNIHYEADTIEEYRAMIEKNKPVPKDVQRMRKFAAGFEFVLQVCYIFFNN